MYIEISKVGSLLLASFVLASFLSCGTSKNMAGKEDLNVPVKVTVNYTADYCGGAYPSDDILKSLKKSKLMTNKKMFVSKAGAEKDAMMEMTTSAEGVFEASLEPGTYMIFLPEKMSEFVSKMVSKEACEAWRKTPNGSFEVTEESSSLTVNIHKTCNPCQEPLR